MLEIRTFEISLFLVAASPVWSYAADEHRIIPQHSVVAAELQGFLLFWSLWPLSPPTSDIGGWGPTTSTSSEEQAPPPAQFGAAPSVGRAS